MTRDPIGNTGGLNLYSYCGNNSVKHVDPNGKIVPALAAIVLFVSSNSALIGASTAATGVGGWIVWSNTGDAREALNVMSMVPILDTLVDVTDTTISIRN